MNKIPFNPYDFFGYLASGLLIVASMDLVFGFPTIIGRDLKLAETAVLILVMYVAGQIVATPAKALLEDLLLAKILKRPSIRLFQERKFGVLSLIFPGYYQPLPPQARNRVLAKAREEKIENAGEDLFLHVRYSSAVLNNEKLAHRLDNFLNQYGFHRNLCFSALVVGIALLIRAKIVIDADPALSRYGTTALVAGVFLFYRYLKFFRQYSYELFNTYGTSR